MEIELQLQNREALGRVQARVDGCLAIHPTLGAASELYTVTHVPTGYALRRDLTEAQARQLVDRLLALDLPLEEMTWEAVASKELRWLPVAREILNAGPVLRAWETAGRRQRVLGR